MPSADAGPGFKTSAAEARLKRLTIALGVIVIAFRLMFRGRIDRDQGYVA